MDRRTVFVLIYCFSLLLFCAPAVEASYCTVCGEEGVIEESDWPNYDDPSSARCFCDDACLTYNDCCTGYVDMCRKPTISLISPQSGITAGGEQITVSTGRNLYVWSSPFSLHCRSFLPLLSSLDPISSSHCLC